jgi:putative transposase
VSDKDDSWAPELVKRQFTAEAQNRLRVADFTYVSTWAGTAYTAFGIDVFFRRIVRSTCSLSKEKDLVLDAIEMGLKERAVLLEGGARTSSFTILTRAISTTSFRFTRTVLRGCGAAMGRT